MAKKIIFLDRDGTIIEDKKYLNDPTQVEYLPDAFEALAKLKNAGYEFVVVTNQSGIPRGKVQVDKMHAIHEVIKNDFKKHQIDFLDFYFSPHLPDSDHPFRKPAPGMLLQAEKDHGEIDFKKSWMLGDRMSDVECGHRAGCKSILLHTTEESKKLSPFDKPEYETDNLMDAVEFILNS